MIARGRLRWRVTLSAPIASDDGFAAVEASFVVRGKRWADKVDVSDRERIAAAAQGQTLTSRFTLLYDTLSSVVTPKWHLVCDGVTYEITGAKELGFRDGVELTATSLP